MATGTFRAALAEAKAELDKVRQQYEELWAQKEKLESLVSSLQMVLPPVQEELPMEMPPHESFMQPAESRMRRSPNGTRKLAIDAIRKAGHPLTIPEIYTYTQSVVGGAAPQKESIRVLLIRRTDTFRQMGNGLYGLKEGYEEALQEEEEAAVA